MLERWKNAMDKGNWLKYSSLRLIVLILYPYTLSTWAEITVGVPQGSVLGPLLFDIYFNDTFYFISEVSMTNFADDITLYQ